MQAQEPSAAELAKKAQNPIANMISVPLQNNTNFGIGPYDRTQNVLNIQPVLPTGLGGW
ncbi:MAG: neuromedin U, partial [Bacteroidota bacterium]